MIIQFDTAHSVGANEALKAPLIEMINEKMDRFDKDISRLEVHLSDENGHKTGVHDKRLMALLMRHLVRSSPQYLFSMTLNSDNVSVYIVRPW